MKLTSLDVSEEKTGWIQTELEEGEHIVWRGEPVPRYFAGNAAQAMTVGVLWTGFVAAFASLSWSTTPNRSEAWALTAFFFVPFLAIGLFMLGYPIWQRRRLVLTAYAITDRRVIVVDHDIRDRRGVRSFAPHDLKALTVTVYGDETGDVMFAVEPRHSADDGSPPIGFLHVREPRVVARAIRALAAQEAA